MYARGLRTLLQLERLAPGSIAFTIANRKIFGETLAAAATGTRLGDRATGLTSAPCVTANEASAHIVIA